MTLRSIKTPYLFLAVLLISIASLCGALYIQIIKHVRPCPLCVLQRYMFVFLCVISLFALIFKYKKSAAVLGFISSATGLGLSIYQLWLIAHPAISCGRDPLEAWVNRLYPSKWLAVLFHSDNYCSAKIPPFIFLTPPQWGVVWFAVFLLIFIRIIFSKQSAK